jgi:hypothetical protein
MEAKNYKNLFFLGCLRKFRKMKKKYGKWWMKFFLDSLSECTGMMINLQVTFSQVLEALVKLIWPGFPDSGLMDH